MPSLMNFYCEYQELLEMIVEQFEEIELQLQEVERMNDESMLMLIDIISTNLIPYELTASLKQGFRSIKQRIGNIKLRNRSIKNKLSECKNMIKEKQDADKRSNKRRTTCLKKEAKRRRLVF